MKKLIQRDSPTASKGAMRILLTIAASKQWVIKTTDIKSAFLQGKELNRNVYLKPPKESEAPDGIIWKLKHCSYGLKDGARQFYLSVNEVLSKLGCTQSKFDPAVYILKTDKLHGLICCHVDDFLHAGDQKLDIIMKKLCQRFLAGKMEEKMFNYIGFQSKQTKDRITLDHTKYIHALESHTMHPERAL